jgi:hypothetical protein
MVQTCYTPLESLKFSSFFGINFFLTQIFFAKNVRIKNNFLKLNPQFPAILKSAKSTAEIQVFQRCMAKLLYPQHVVAKKCMDALSQVFPT